MLWGDNWTLLDWIRQHTDYSKDTRTTPVDVDVLTRLHEYATGIANQNGRHDVRRGEAACIVAGVESVQSYLRRNPGVELEFASISPHRRRSLIVSEKIDLQQEALNALKDAGLGSNSLRQASSKRGKQLSVNQPLTDSEAKKIFINGAEDFYSLSANPQFSNVAELFDAWLTEHDRQLLAKTETEAGKRISSELKLEHASDAHARTEPSRAYIQGCKAARSLLEDAIRDMTQEQGTL